VAVASTANANTHGHGRRPVIRCVKGLTFGLKTLSDRDRELIRLNPVTTTIKALATKNTTYRRTHHRRTRGFERQVWRVVAEITLYRVDSDGTMQLVLFDDGTYMQAEMPAVSCIPRNARNRTGMEAARNAFARCGPATEQYQPLGAVAFLNGVGYWGRHTGPATAPNGAKLSPVVRFVPLAGCGAGR
jgi:hypothetical protein